MTPIALAKPDRPGFPLLVAIGLRLSLVCLVAILSGAGCDNSVKKRPKYPVFGAVLVNGKPAEGVTVTLTPEDTGEYDATVRPASGISDAEGNFELSTTSEADGVVAGDYRVTFQWLESPGSRDRFGGTFADAAKSTFHVTVEAGDNEIGPYELEMPRQVQ